jgi:hypothetical protein
MFLLFPFSVFSQNIGSTTQPANEDSSGNATVEENNDIREASKDELAPKIVNVNLLDKNPKAYLLIFSALISIVGIFIYLIAAAFLNKFGKNGIFIAMFFGSFFTPVILAYLYLIFNLTQAYYQPFRTLTGMTTYQFFLFSSLAGIVLNILFSFIISLFTTPKEVQKFICEHGESEKS